MTGYQSERRRSPSVLSLSVGLLSLLVVPFFPKVEVHAKDATVEAKAEESLSEESTEEENPAESSSESPAETFAAALDQEPLKWARIIFLRNRAQLLRENEEARRANVSDMLQVGDSLRTLRRSRAELRFNDESLARIGERATFQFTPNTRNFQLTNGTVLLLIPPSVGRTTIQTPNAVTGVQGSALFVRYIPETETTIVGALTDNPNGPMVLFNEDGSEQQALRANEIGVIRGDRITELYQFDSELFWESSALAEGFDYTQDSPTGSDALDAVRQEIRDAIASQDPLPENDGNVIENPESFSRPSDEPEEKPVNSGEGAEDNVAPSEESTEQGEQSTEQGEQSTEQGEQSTEQGEQSTEQSEQSTEQGEASQVSTQGESEGAAGRPDEAQNTVSDSGANGVSTEGNATPSAGAVVDNSTPTQSPPTQSAGSAALTAPQAGSGTPSNGQNIGGGSIGAVTTSDTQTENASIVEAGAAAGAAAIQTIVPTAPSPVAPENQAPLAPVAPLDPADVAEESAAIEPRVEIEFKGTPAETYLSVPQSEVQTEISDIGENNDLVAAPSVTGVGTESSAGSSGNGVVTTVESEASVSSSETAPTPADDPASTIAQPEKLPTDIEEQAAGVDLDVLPAVEAITDPLAPVGLTSDPVVGGEVPGDGGPGDDVPDIEEPSPEVPAVEDPVIEVAPPLDPPSDIEPPTEPPIIPEMPEDVTDNSGGPIIPVEPPVLLIEEATPDVADPVLPVVEVPAEEVIVPPEIVDQPVIVEQPEIVDQPVIVEQPEIVEAPVQIVEDVTFEELQPVDLPIDVVDDVPLIEDSGVNEPANFDAGEQIPDTQSPEGNPVDERVLL